MIPLIFCFIFLAAAVYIGCQIATAHGFILITYNHWVIESSLWVALSAMVLLFGINYIVFRFITRSLRLRKNYHAWQKTRRTQRAHQRMQKGLCYLAEGRWRKAEKMLLKAADITDQPLVLYLAAAQAAHKNHALDRRDLYLQKAYAADKKATLATGLARAHLQIDSEQWDAALSTLQTLYDLHPRHTEILKCLFETHRARESWNACLTLLPAIKQYKAYSATQYETIAHQIYLECLKIAAEKERSMLVAYWKWLPKRYRRDPLLMAAYEAASASPHDVPRKTDRRDY